MAAPLSARRLAVGNMTLVRSLLRRAKPVIAFRYRSTAPLQDEYVDVAEYPPVKPMYPPGQWGQMKPEKAWEWYEEAEEILQIKDPRWRLEKYAGPEQIYMWKINHNDVKPRSLQHKQTATKSHIVEALPEHYSRVDVTSFIPKLSTMVADVIAQENERIDYLTSHGLSNQRKGRFREKGTQMMIRQILATIQSSLTQELNYMPRAQFDENVDVNSFWYRCGYEDYKIKGKRKDNLVFQSLGKASFQVRTELPLPEFIGTDSELSVEAPVPAVEYAPTQVGFHYMVGRPTSLAGYWIGDPCEFIQMGVYCNDYNYKWALQNYGQRHADESVVGCGLVSSFSSCLAQAYNQGFSMHHEVTYPITTQTVVTDGRQFRFFAYQLNTMQLWKENETNPLRNILWASEPMSLYDTIEGTTVKGFNKETLANLLKFVCTEPGTRNVELRPYLQDHEAPRNQSSFINNLGEPTPEYPPRERFLYPRDAVYF